MKSERVKLWKIAWISATESFMASILIWMCPCCKVWISSLNISLRHHYFWVIRSPSDRKDCSLRLRFSSHNWCLKTGKWMTVSQSISRLLQALNRKTFHVHVERSCDWKLTQWIFNQIAPWRVSINHNSSWKFSRVKNIRNLIRSFITLEMSLAWIKL